MTRSTTSSLPLRWRRVHLTSLVTTEMSGASRPGCQTCSVQEHGAAPGATPLAARFEAAVAMPPKPYADLKAHQMHYKASNVALQQRFRTWPTAPRTPLPAPDYSALGGAPAPGGPQTEVSEADLSLLLATIAGVAVVTPERVFRWTASGGNIGSVLARVVVRRSGSLTPGVYAFVAPDHALALVSRDVDAVPGVAPVTLVLTGDYRKVAQKYAAFALRIVLLDSGCAQATAALVGVQLGVPVRPRSDWSDERIADALDIDPDAEPLTAVVDLGGRAIGGRP